MSQHKLILAHLKRGNSITKVDCIKYFHIINLGDCILVLRRKGHNIATTMVRNRKGRKFAIYSLIINKES